MATNAEMYGMLVALEPLLDQTGMVGYAAARNTRLLQEACAEYLKVQEGLVSELGDKELDSEGNPTGMVSMSQSSEGFQRFIEELKPYADIEHPFEPFKIPAKDAIGTLTGSQMLALEWMIDD